MEHVLEKLGRSYKRRDENLGSERKAGPCQLSRGTAREGARPQRPLRDVFRKTGQRGQPFEPGRKAILPQRPILPATALHPAAWNYLRSDGKGCSEIPAYSCWCQGPFYAIIFTLGSTALQMPPDDSQPQEHQHQHTPRRKRNNKLFRSCLLPLKVLWLGRVLLSCSTQHRRRRKEACVCSPLSSSSMILFSDNKATPARQPTLILEIKRIIA